MNNVNLVTIYEKLEELEDKILLSHDLHTESILKLIDKRLKSFDKDVDTHQD